MFGPMSQTPRDPGHEERIDLSETFTKSAGVVTQQPSASFQMPDTMMVLGDSSAGAAQAAPDQGHDGE